MGEYFEKTKKKVMEALDDLADLKGLKAGVEKLKKHPRSRAGVKFLTKGPGRAKDVRHVFKAGQR